MTRRRVLGAAAALAIVVQGIGATPSRAIPGCATGTFGGEWRSYSHDLANSRFQDAETGLGPAEAAHLSPAWIFNGAGAGATGDFDNTPVVADGCLFLASTTGHVVALDADTGDVVWHHQLDDGVQSTPAVFDGRVFLTVDRSDAPYAVALDESDGHLLWRTGMDHQSGSDTFSSPAVFDGLVVAGVSGAGAEAGTTFTGDPQKRLGFRGAYVILDEVSGAVLHHDYVINDADFAAGNAGGGVWASAAVDPANRYAYFGTGNPFSSHEHPNTNAIVKIDIDRTRATFGTIVGTYHGTPDLYVPNGYDKPVCAVYVDVFTCDPPDFDFGASAQLFTAPDGSLLVGDMQKAGVYHTADASTMAPRWHTTVGGPFGQFGGEATAAFDGRSLYTAGNVPGLMMSLDKNAGAVQWAQPIADGIHFQPVTVASGVVYVTDTRGFVDIWNAATGDVIAVRSMAQDTGQTAVTSFSTGFGVAVARHTVYIPTPGGFVVAYRAAG